MEGHVKESGVYEDGAPVTISGHVHCWRLGGISYTLRGSTFSMRHFSEFLGIVGGWTVIMYGIGVL
jgi:hypothetical protein